MMDYVSIALNRLTNQFQDSTLLKALVSAMVGPLTGYEDTLDQLRTQRWVDTAIGAQLDGLGSIVGEPRRGRDDDAYREAILFRIFVNTSNATPEDMMTGLRFITKADDIQYMEQYPATAILWTGGPVISSTLQETMQSLAPAAISDVQVIVSYSGLYPFRFGKTSPPSELFVNHDSDYLVANGADLQVQMQLADVGSRLGGIAASDLFVNEMYLELSDGSTLAVNVPNYDAIIDSGYRLQGVFA